MARKKTSPKKHPKMAVLGTFDHFCHIRFLANVLKLDVVLTPNEARLLLSCHNFKKMLPYGDPYGVILHPFLTTFQQKWKNSACELIFY